MRFTKSLTSDFRLRITLANPDTDDTFLVRFLRERGPSGELRYQHLDREEDALVVQETITLKGGETETIDIIHVMLLFIS